MLFEVVAELVVGEAECRGGAALVEMVRRQCVAEQLLLVGRDAAEEVAGCAGSAARSGDGGAAGCAGRCGEAKASKTTSPIGASGYIQR